MKTRIVDIAIRLIHENGFDSVTMECIAKSCAITKRTLYRYFPVKEAILCEYIRMAFRLKKENRIRTLTQTQGMENKVRLYMEDLMRGVMNEPLIFEKFIIYVMKNLVGFDASDTNPSGITDLLEWIIRAGYEEDKIDLSLPYGLIVDLFIFSFVEMTKIYYRDKENFDMDKAVNMCVDLFMKGIKRKAVSNAEYPEQNHHLVNPKQESAEISV